MGPLVTREHRDRVASYVDLGGQEGADVVVRGRFVNQRLAAVPIVDLSAPRWKKQSKSTG